MENSDNKVTEHKAQSEWKIQLTMEINFISSKNYDETRTMHTNGNNVEIMMGSETDEIIDELFKSSLQKYQEGLEESMRGSEFVYDSVDALYYNLNKVNLSSCTLTVALNYEKVKKRSSKNIKN